jgi:isopentenyldiphosphate isomerase
VTIGAQASRERVDVVDEGDRIVATVTRGEVRARNLRHRCVFVLVRRSDGRVLVQQRSPAKDVWPSAWDVGVGGVVVSGEGWDEAARRELAEEVGIVDAPLRFVRSGRYDDAEVSEVARVYEVDWDGPIVFNDGEVVTAAWLTPTELAARLTEETFCPDTLALTGDLLR